MFEFPPELEPMLDAVPGLKDAVKSAVDGYHKDRDEFEKKFRSMAAITSNLNDRLCKIEKELIAVKRPIPVA